jgi:hypothetical protein
LHERLVGSDVRVVILVDERLDGLANQHVHVLADGVGGLDVVLGRDELVRVLYAQHLDHLTVQLRQVVYLRRLLRHLQHSLVLHHALRHGELLGSLTGMTSTIA